MNILICPDKFKGSASASEVANAIEQGLKKSYPNAKVVTRPIADGGEGFSRIAAMVLEGEWVECETLNAIHQPIIAQYFVSDQVAYLDMASASGLDRVESLERDPWFSSTKGTGIMMRHAIDRGVRKIIVGLGGSATNDGGAGMAAELGVEFLDFNGDNLDPVPSELMHCVAINTENLIALPETVAACDVFNVLLGESGATAVYGPQKGVIDVASMDSVLQLLVHLGGGLATANHPGAGAAGGLAYGLMHYANAELRSGFELVSEMILLENAIAESDVVITGEGSLDRQTLNGKGPHGVALLARKHQKTVIAVTGQVEGDVCACFDQIICLTETGKPVDVCIANAEVMIQEMVSKLDIEPLDHP